MLTGFCYLIFYSSKFSGDLSFEPTRQFKRKKASLKPNLD